MDAKGGKDRKVRQAVVMVHGMGEQRPLQTLNQFIAAALEPDPAAEHNFFSRPDEVTDSYEARVYLAPRAPREGHPEARAQTEFYEYHWAHLMQGNRIDDLWPTFRRMLLRPPKRVPSGLIVVWALFWLAILATVYLLWQRDFTIDYEKIDLAVIVQALLGAGAAGVALTYLVSRVLPGWLTTSFVDVVRYLDTSPRSYQVRREIRKGMVDLLVKLHGAKNLDGTERYQRIIVVAHSLGAFIAYDGIAYLWSHIDQQLPARRRGAGAPEGLENLERKASLLPDQHFSSEGLPVSEAKLDDYRVAQRRLWLGLRHQGNPWRITDLITLGTPMYFTDRLYTKNVDEFKQRVARGELPTCPPQDEGQEKNNINSTKRWYSWERDGRREMDYKAAFAVVRWTNMWFPARLHFFGDWFGNRLAPLFGNGIKDIRLERNLPRAAVPGYAHAQYLRFPNDTSDGSVTTILRKSMDLASTWWLQGTTEAPRREQQRDGRS
jgi:hypothetical protein